MRIKKNVPKIDRKRDYDMKLCKLLNEYSSVLIVEADHVGSTQLAAVRTGIRGESELLMGKNTLIRRCIKVHAEATGNDNKAMENWLPMALTGVPRAWLLGLPESSVASWEELHDLFLAHHVAPVPPVVAALLGGSQAPPSDRHVKPFFC